MIRITKIMLAATLGLAGLIAMPAIGQDSDDYRRGQWDQRNQNDGYSTPSQNQAYQTGVADGQWDIRHGQQQRSRNWKTTAEAQAYRSGYNNTVNSANNGNYNNGRNNGRHHDRNRGWGNNGNGNNYPNHNGGYNSQYGNDAGSRQGYIDGRNDGTADLQGGFNYRPTEKYAYKDANHGLKESGMSKDAFVQSYKAAYLEGYKQSYNARR